MAELDRRQFLVGSAGGAFCASTGRWPVRSDALLRLPAEPAGLTRPALRQLRAAVKGRVLVPQGSAALVYNTRFDGRRPDAVVQVRDTADVAATVRWANRFDVRLVARSGGHSYGGYSSTSDGVVLDLSRLRGSACPADARPSDPPPSSSTSSGRSHAEGSPSRQGRAPPSGWAGSR
jgi:hypothetical protein